MRRQRERQRRLKHADYLEIQRRLSEGETFEVVGAAVCCSTKTIQRFMLRTGGPAREISRALPAAVVRG